MSAPNGFDGAWNPICPLCGGYMHAHHKLDCPVEVAQERRIREIAEAFREMHFPAAQRYRREEVSEPGCPTSRLVASTWGTNPRMRTSEGTAEPGSLTASNQRERRNDGS